MSIRQRKQDHAELCANSDVSYRKTAGFERYDFVHDALPELNPEEVSTSATLLGREFSFPLLISSMTGGYSGAEGINSSIARFCQEQQLPFGVGSQRAMLEDPGHEKSFSVVRKEAPDAFIAANIGGAQLVGGLPEEHLERLIDVIRADAVIVHLNPLQELVQPEGDRHFEGVEEGIARLVTRSNIPVMVKETGAGISSHVAERLLAVGVEVIDVSGAGGTSWARVENMRADRSDKEDLQRAGFEPFEEWGIPTVDCIEQVSQLRETFRFEIIASGGIRNPFDMAKAMALGADFTATAQPVIIALKSGDTRELTRMLDIWRRQFKMILTLLGCRSPSHLLPRHLRIV